MKAKANRAKGATTARRTVAPATAAQARDELRAREIAQRLVDLFFHCEEAQASMPDEPLFSFESMFKAEAERTKSDGTPKHVIRRAIAIYIKSMKAEEKDRPRRLAAWKARADEIRREDFINRHAESTAYFETHKNDPDEGRCAVDEYREICRAENERNEREAAKDFFYYVTPKTPKPDCKSWIDKRLALLERLDLMGIIGKRYGEANANARQREEAKPKSLDSLFDEAERQARQAHGNAAAVAIKAARDIYLAYTGAASPDEVKTMQRERAADWIKAEDTDGNAPSIAQAAQQFGNEIEAERETGGYANVEALRTALYKSADELGIAKFKKRGK